MNKFQRSAIKSHKEKIEPSENRIKGLLGINHKNAIILHGGMGSPDWIVIDAFGRTTCYEIKPYDAKSKISMLPTNLQRKVFAKLIKKKILVNLVYYKTKGKKKALTYNCIPINSVKKLNQLFKLKLQEIKELSNNCPLKIKK